eukprot:355508-Chlamydomonas_euryale.AAC.9
MHVRPHGVTGSKSLAFSAPPRMHMPTQCQKVTLICLTRPRTIRTHTCLACIPPTRPQGGCSNVFSQVLKVPPPIPMSALSLPGRDAAFPRGGGDGDWGAAAPVLPAPHAGSRASAFAGDGVGRADAAATAAAASWQTTAARSGAADGERGTAARAEGTLAGALTQPGGAGRRPGQLGSMIADLEAVLASGDWPGEASAGE